MNLPEPTADDLVNVEEADRRIQRALQNTGHTIDDLFTYRGALKDFVADLVRQQIRERH